MNNRIFRGSIICCLALLCATHKSAAQTTPVKPLKRGDMLPEIILSSREGNPVPLKTEKGKLLIIDFWNVNCAGCVKAFIKLDSLHEIFKDTVRIVSVTYNDNESISRFFNKLKRKPPVFPIVASDTHMKRLFPHQGDPYYVWVMDGRILHLSNDWSLSYKNIKEILSGTRLQLSQRLSLPSYNRSVTLLNSLLPIEKYSLFLTGLDDYNVGGNLILRDSVNDNPFYLKAVNKTKLELITQAYWKDIFGFESYVHKVPNDQISVDSSATELLSPSADENVDEWRRQNLFSYEIKVRLSESADIYKKMQEDLAVYFPYIIEKGIRIRPALVLEIEDSLLFEKAKQHTINQKPVARLEKDFRSYTNVTLGNSIVNLLMSQSIFNKGLPCVNNTGYEGAVSITVHGNIFDLSNLRKHLQLYGLRLVERDYPLKCMIIKKR